MGAGDGWHFMPDDRLGVLRACAARLNNGEILNALGIEMNFAMLVASEAFQHFGKGALRTVPAVNEGGDDGEAQVSATVSVGHTSERAERVRPTGQKQQESAIGIGCQAEAKDRRSRQNPRMAGFR